MDGVLLKDGVGMAFDLSDDGLKFVVFFVAFVRQILNCLGVVFVESPEGWVFGEQLAIVV